MYFRRYETNSATLREWARQLNVSKKGYYLLYETEEQTLSHWKTVLNTYSGVNTFDLKKDVDSTLSDWKDKLNIIYNK